MLTNNRGFTLIEMLIVMLIVSFLLLLLIPNLSTQSESVNEKGCEALVAVVQAQADAYYLEEGELVEEIDTLIGNYLKKEQTKCGGKKIEVSEGKANLTTIPADDE